MLKILHTGDLHLGREYKNQTAEVAGQYKDARLKALKNILTSAERNNCDYVVIAGDLFDSKYVSAALIKDVCALLGRCVCPVIVLPGNHDFCEGNEDKLWNSFRKNASENTSLLAENKPVPMDGAVFYPCVCFDKHSEKNMLDWVTNSPLCPEEGVRIGIAHGAIEGLSCDNEKRYYYMTLSELNACRMDLWLIGHTHIPYPSAETVSDQRIFNAGTHQQTDISDNSEGSVFIITVDDGKKVSARREKTGVIRFVQKSVDLDHGQELEAALKSAVAGMDPETTSIRLTVNGTAFKEDFEKREEIYERVLGDMIKYDVFDSGMRAEITMDMIDAETVEGSLENDLLKRYADEPELLNLAYDLVIQCKEGK